MLKSASSFYVHYNYMPQKHCRGLLGKPKSQMITDFSISLELLPTK